MFRMEKQGAVNVIRGQELFNAAVAEEFAEIVDACLSKGTGRIVVDLGDVQLIDSAGLESLVDLQARCLRRGGALKIAGAKHVVGEVLRVTGVADQIETFANAISAAGSFAD